MRSILLIPDALLVAAWFSGRVLLEVCVAVVLVPLGIMLALLLLSFDALCALARPRGSATSASPRPAAPSTATVLLWMPEDEWHGAEVRLRELWPRTLPEPEVLRAREPIAARALGDLAAAARGDLLFVLGGRASLTPELLRALAAAWTAADVFAVSPFRVKGEMRAGFLHLVVSQEQHPGGSLVVDLRRCAFDRRKLLAILGRDDVPGDLLAIELAFAAWKCGWRVLTTGATSTTAAGIAPADLDDALLQLVWRDVSDPGQLLRHGIGLPWHLLRRARRRHDEALPAAVLHEAGFLARGIARLPCTLARRAALRSAVSLPDRAALLRARSEGSSAAEVTSDVAAVRPRLRILVLCGRLPRRNTDGSWILFNLLRELSTRHTVTLWSLIEGDDDAVHVAALREHCHEVTVHLARSRRRTANLHHLVPYRLARDYSRATLQHLVRELLLQRDFDVLQVEYAELGSAIHALVRGLPAIYTCHESLAVQHQRLCSLTHGPGKLLAWFESAQNVEHEIHMMRSFVQVVALSSADAAMLRSLAPELPIAVIPSGIDVPADSSATGSDGAVNEPIIAFVGYFKHPPNVDAALWLAREVFPRVRARHSAASLRLVGRDPPAELLALHGAGICVTGFVPDIHTELANAAVVAAPLRLGGGLRGKMLEAWAAGKAVIATTIARAGFEAEDGRHLLVADDAETFADAIVRCLEDPELRRRLGLEGRQLVQQRYSTAAMAAGYEAVYAKLCARSAASRRVAGDPALDPTAGDSDRRVGREPITDSDREHLS